MKTIKIKPLILSTLVCLLPILLGLALYDKLPGQIAVHFDVHNTPDNFASKPFAVFGLPLLMAALQVVCCVTSDINAARKGCSPKAEAAMKSIIPFTNLLIYTTTILYAMGIDVDIRRIAVFICGVIFMVLGNYMPKFNAINTFGKQVQNKPLLRRIGYMTVGIGILFLLSSFLPSLFSVIALLLLIPYSILLIVMTVKYKNEA